jgi:hypothetical protein
MSNQQAAKYAKRPQLRLRDCYWFFLPLVLMVELNMISKSVIHAFLARTDDPSVALAAFNAAFTFYFAITAASEVTTVLCLSFMKSRRDSLRLSAFTAMVLSLPIAVALAVAFTPAGNAVFGSWFSLGVLRIVTAAAAASIAIPYPDLNGATIGISAWILSYAVETAVSTWRLRRLRWYVDG